MTEERQQLYLRAEPTAEGRECLRAHQEHIAAVLRGLQLTPRLTRAADLHWTAIFLGSPERWTRALRVVGADVPITAADLITLANLRRVSAWNSGGLRVPPVGYDVFYKGVANAVFVLQLHDQAAQLTQVVFNYFRASLTSWETSGRVPVGTTTRLFRHPWFPLRRYGRGGRPFDPAQGKPHITLARGRVRPDRQREVHRTIRAVPLQRRERITFARADVRIARSPVVVATDA